MPCGSELLDEEIGILFGHMSPGIAEHVYGAKLDLCVWKKGFDNFVQAGEIVLDGQQDASQSSVDQFSQNLFPIFKAFPPLFGKASKDPLVSLPVESDDDVEGKGLS